jgi:hypothetical protein
MQDIEAGAAPVGTSAKIRNRAIWSVALFAASVVPAIIGVGLLHATTEVVNIATPFAFGLWALGALCSIAAAVPTLRHWDRLPLGLRWLGALPLLSVSLLLTLALAMTLVMAPTESDRGAALTENDSQYRPRGRV